MEPPSYLEFFPSPGLSTLTAYQLEVKSMKIPIYYKSLLFDITSNKWKNTNEMKRKETLILSQHSDSMIELFSYIETSSIAWLSRIIMQCLFKEVHLNYISSKMLQYQTNDAFSKGFSKNWHLFSKQFPHV